MFFFFSLNLALLCFVFFFFCFESLVFATDSNLFLDPPSSDGFDLFLSFSFLPMSSSPDNYIMDDGTIGNMFTANDDDDLFLLTHCAYSNQQQPLLSSKVKARRRRRNTTDNVVCSTQNDAPLSPIFFRNNFRISWTRSRVQHKGEAGRIKMKGMSRASSPRWIQRNFSVVCSQVSLSYSSSRFAGRAISWTRSGLRVGITLLFRILDKVSFLFFFADLMFSPFRFVANKLTHCTHASLSLSLSLSPNFIWTY